MYRKLLIATDGSEIAGKALAHGLALAKGVGASLVTVVMVTEVWSMIVVLDAEAGKAAQQIAEFETKEAKHAAQVLAAAATEAANAGVSCETRHIKDNHPSDGILKAAEEAGCDLIVMSSHGRRGINRLLLGSVAAEVVTLSKVPVLIVR